jgi:hypothetical protein
MWGTLISVSANVGLNLFFMKIIGVPGIALSTSVVLAVSCVYLSIVLFRTLRQNERASEPVPIPVEMVPVREVPRTDQLADGFGDRLYRAEEHYR